MALDRDKLKAKMKQSIEAGMARNFGGVAGTASYGGVSKEQWQKIADAISDIALDVVDAIQKEAEVAPGIPVTTAGGPSNQAGATVAPGKIV